MTRSSKLKCGNFVSRTALGLALALGVVAASGVTATPAHAAKKEKQSAPKFSKEFVAVAGPIQEEVNALEKKSKEGVDVSAEVQALVPKIDAAAPAATSPTEKVALGQFVLTLGQISQNNQLNQRGVKMMLDSGGLDAERTPLMYFYLGNFAYSNRDYATCASALGSAGQAGFEHEALLELLVQCHADAGMLQQGLAIANQIVERDLAAGKKPSAQGLNRAVAAAYKANLGTEAIQFATTVAKLYPNPTNWLSVAQITRNFVPLDPQASIDLYRLMDRSGALGAGRKYTQYEYKEYVETANPIRLPGEVKRIIDQGMANGALQPSDTWATQAKETAVGRIAADRAAIKSEVASAMKNPNGKVAQALADAFLNYGDAAQAEELYLNALGKSGSEQDLVLTRLGIVQLDQGKLAEAKANFAKVGGQRRAVSKLFIMHIDGMSAPVSAAAAPAPAQ